MEIQGITYHGIASFRPEQEQAENAFIASLRDGTPIVRKTTILRSKASQKQRGAYFGLLVSRTIEQANEYGIDTSKFLELMVRDDLPSGVPLTKDTVYHLLLSLCPVYRDGMKLTLSKMTTEDAARFYTACWNLLSSRGIVIEEPNSNYRSKK